MPSPSRYYSSNAAKTTLANSISSSSASLELAAAANLPTQYPYTLILEKDTANEEIVEVTGLVGTSYQITRNIDSSGAKAHAVGAAVEHGVSARDFTESRAHEVATTSVHGVTGDVVGTGGAQTITGTKTFNAADITASANIKAGGFKITGLANATADTDAVTKQQVDAIAGSATAAASSAAAAASSALAASSSATVASNSAATATTSAATATTQAGIATASAATAVTSAAQAATSAATAVSSAATAVTSADIATTQAGNALASANSAATSASSAALSASSAATSASSAEASYNSTVGQVGSGIVRDMGSIADPDTTTGTYVSIATVADAAAASAASSATSASSAATSASSAATSASSASTFATNAEASDVSAQNWATQLSTPVAGGEYSAKYHAQSSAVSASSAATSASSAAASASAAAGYIPAISAGVNGYFLTNNGTTASWSNLSDWGTL